MLPPASNPAKLESINQVDGSLMICLLGNFRLLKMGLPLPIPGGEKTEALLCSLALRSNETVPRDVLLESLWPNQDPCSATQSLNSLIYSLRKGLANALDGASPILHANGTYCLNSQAGVGVDIVCFDALADGGNERTRAGDDSAAKVLYERAVQLYRGDLCYIGDIYSVTERERLRARHLTVLARLADYSFAKCDYSACLRLARRLLSHEPCREDAHRLMMRCYVRRGERAQAMHQFRVCCDILKAEFDAPPEAATATLFDQIRLASENI